MTMAAETVTLGSVIAQTGGALQTGPFGSQLHASDYQLTGTPLVMPVNLGDNNILERGIARIGTNDTRRLRRHALHDGDIIFSRRGDVGRRSLVRKEQSGWICGTGCLLARFGKSLAEVNPAYVAEYIGSNAAQSWLFDNAVGGTMPNLNTGILAALPVVLPSKRMQDRTVAALNDVRQMISTLERLIAKKQAIKTGMMQQLLTGRTRLPGFTDPWHEVKLGDYVSFVKTVALSRAQLDASSPVRYLHYGDIHTSDSTTLDAAQTPMPRANSALLSNAGYLRVGDLVFADASEDPAGVGKSVEVVSVPEEGVVPGLHTIAARFDKTVLADGFKAYLQFVPMFREALLRLAAGTKVLATTKAYISSISLSLPGIREQQAISETLRDVDAEIRLLHLRLEKARDMKQGMMQQLLTGRTRLPAEATS